MNLGNAIKLCRTQKGISQQKLAKDSGISVSYLSLLEHNKRDPNFSTVQQIASGLGVPLNILMFLAADTSELSSISPELAEKMSYVALKLIEASHDGNA